MTNLAVEQPTKYQTIALQALARLGEGDTDPETLHALRIMLRRLQAFFELEGGDNNAVLVGGCVSRLSQLRSLEVFSNYLSRIGAPKSDAAILDAALAEARAKLVKRQIFRKIERQLWRIPLAAPRLNAHSLQKRIEFLRQQHVNELEELLAAAAEKPRRKRIHVIRLKIKTIRYQEEWLQGRWRTRSDFLKRLKGVQTRLGTYEELAEFRKLAKTFRLESRPMIVKNWRRARKRARALVTELNWVLEHLNCRRLPTSTRRSSTQLAV